MSNEPKKTDTLGASTAAIEFLETPVIVSCLVTARQELNLKRTEFDILEQVFFQLHAHSDIKVYSNHILTADEISESLAHANRSSGCRSIIRGCCALLTGLPTDPILTIPSPRHTRQSLQKKHRR